MKILITGISGFIGQELGWQIFKEGHELVALSRSPERLETENPFPVKAYAWSSQIEKAALVGVDAIIHLAGAPIAGARWTAKEKKKIYESRIQTTKEIVEACKHHQLFPKVFLCASAIGIYGDREDETLTEDSILGDGFLADVCSDWETEARKLETEGVRSAQIRTALVLGDEKGALEKMLPAVRMGLLGKIGSGQQWMSWIHIQDWVRAAIFLLKEDGAKGPFDFSSPQPVRNEEFTDTLNAIFSRRSFIATPKLAIRFAEFIFFNIKCIF